MAGFALQPTADAGSRSELMFFQQTSYRFCFKNI